MTETIQETRMSEAMEPLGEILGSLQELSKNGGAGSLLLSMCFMILSFSSFLGKLSFTTKIIFFAFLAIAFSLSIIHQRKQKEKI